MGREIDGMNAIADFIQDIVGDWYVVQKMSYGRASVEANDGHVFYLIDSEHYENRILSNPRKGALQLAYQSQFSLRIIKSGKAEIVKNRVKKTPEDLGNMADPAFLDKLREALDYFLTNRDKNDLYSWLGAQEASMDRRRLSWREWIQRCSSEGFQGI